MGLDGETVPLAGDAASVENPRNERQPTVNSTAIKNMMAITKNAERFAYELNDLDMMTPQPD